MLNTRFLPRSVKTCLCAMSLCAFSAASMAAAAGNSMSGSAAGENNTHAPMSGNSMHSQVQKGDRDAYNQALDMAKSQYETAKKSCDNLSGNSQDVCEKEAKLERVKTEAQAKADYKSTKEASRDAKVDIAKAQYALDKEKCDDMSGNTKDVCVKEAKSSLKKAKAEAEGAEKVSEAKTDMRADQNKAEYEVAKERCDSLSGNAKDACEKDAKSRYNM